MCKKRICAVFTILAFFFMGTTLAEAQEKKYNLGFSAGLCKWPSEVFKYRRIHVDESFVKLYRGLNTLDEEINLNAVYNLSFQYNFSSRFGIQAEIGHQRADYKAIFYMVPQNPEARGSYTPQHVLPWSASTIFFNAIFQAQKPEKKIIPYAFVGLGLCFVQGKVEEEYRNHYKLAIRSTADLGLKAGGGMTFYLPKILPLGLNIRAFIQVLGAYIFGYASSYGEFVTEVGGWNIIWGIDTGLRYRF